MNIYKVHYSLSVAYDRPSGGTSSESENFSGHLQVLAETAEGAERLAKDFLKDTDHIWEVEEGTGKVTTVYFRARHQYASGIYSSLLMEHVDPCLSDLCLPEITYYIE